MEHTKIIESELPAFDLLSVEVFLPIFFSIAGKRGGSNDTTWYARSLTSLGLLKKNNTPFIA